MARSNPNEGELKFELLAEIAVGETARVELCRVTEGARLGQLVAVKRLHPHIAEDPQFVDMFRDEVWMTAALKHRHVVEVVGWGQDGEGPWLAVEFVRGVSLQRLMKTVFETGERFTERMVVFLARSMCDGLGTAHSLRSADGEHLNLVHRDLTPGNVLLGFDGQVKITDFGLAKAKQRLTKTLTGLLKGQPQYMSPEQVRGETLDARSDIFALGVLLFELFSGQRPWKAQTDLDAMRAITDDEPADLQVLRPRIDRALVDIVMHSLEKDKEVRFQSALEARDRFDQWLVAHGYRDDNHSSLARFVRRNAMRQMRWFERAVAGEFAANALAEKPPVSMPSVPSLGSFGKPPRSQRGTSTHATARATPGSRAPGSRLLEPPRIPDPPASRPLNVPRGSIDSSAPTPRPGERVAEPGVDRSSIDWGEDGPTLIQRAEEARAEVARLAAEQSAAPIPPQREPEESQEANTLRQQPSKSARAPMSRARQTVDTGPSAFGRSSVDDDLAMRIADAATAAHEESGRAPTADDTVQLNEAQRELLRAIDTVDELRPRAPGVVVAPGPEVPPLPPERPFDAIEPDSTITRAQPTPLADTTITRHTGGLSSPNVARLRPPPSPDRRVRQTTGDADGTIPRAKPPSEGLLAKTAPMHDTGSQSRYQERSSDFIAEAQRLGGEARAAGENAARAADRAEAAARVAALAGEAALLAARGERHDAIQKLREAQLVDELLKRGGLPARAPLRLDADVIGTGRHRVAGDGWLGFFASREGATILVIAALSLLVTVLFVVWLAV